MGVSGAYSARLLNAVSLLAILALAVAVFALTSVLSSRDAPEGGAPDGATAEPPRYTFPPPATYDPSLDADPEARRRMMAQFIYSEAHSLQMSLATVVRPESCPEPCHYVRDLVTRIQGTQLACRLRPAGESRESMGYHPALMEPMVAATERACASLEAPGGEPADTAEWWAAATEALDILDEGLSVFVSALQAAGVVIILN